MTSSNKKLIILIAAAVVLVAVLLIVLLACGKRKPDGPDVGSESSSDTEATIPTEGPSTTKEPEESTSNEPQDDTSSNESESSSEPVFEPESESQSGQASSEESSSQPTPSEPETTVTNPVDESMKPVNDEIYITASNVQARIAAVVHDTTKYKVIHYGEKYSRTYKGNEWSLIYVDGISCYVSNQYISTVAPPEIGSGSTSAETPSDGFVPCSTIYYVATWRLWVRTSPSNENDSNIAFQYGFKQGDRIEPIATNGRWARIMIDGKVYYVGMTALVTDRNQIHWLEEDVTSKPAVTTPVVTDKTTEPETEEAPSK